MLFVNSIEEKERVIKGEELKRPKAETQKKKLQATPTVVMWACGVLSPASFFRYFVNITGLVFCFIIIIIIIITTEEEVNKQQHTDRHTHTLEASSVRDEATNKKKKTNNFSILTRDHHSQ